MAQVRFRIGVPGAGSAARDAESARDSFRTLRPEAGSAARQAEEERRNADIPAMRRMNSTTIRMQTPSQRPAEWMKSASESAEAQPRKAENGASAASNLPSSPVPSMSAEKPAAALAPAGTLSGAEPTHNSLEASPLQTAAAKFRSLFRSVFPRAAGEN
ncbi:hypothetical protein [Terriglobus sp.]|uniref:hypothetical protein n=1 Tax=Terriglobus sp. TaxID=1889013 RepID=UPI003B004D2F